MMTREKTTTRALLNDVVAEVVAPNAAVAAL